MQSVLRIITAILACAASAATSGQSMLPADPSARPVQVAPNDTTPIAPLPTVAGQGTGQGIQGAGYEAPSGTPMAPAAADAARSQPSRGGVSGYPASLPLPARRAEATTAAEGNAARADRLPKGGTTSLVTVASSLVIVLGLFSLFVWTMRRTMPGQVPVLPKEVVEVLGRAALASRQQVYLMRCGSKLLLVSVSPAGVDTLTEVVDPPEVDRLLGLCVQARPDSTSAAFRQFFQQFTQEPVGRRARSGDSARTELAETAYARSDRARREDRHG